MCSAGQPQPAPHSERTDHAGCARALQPLVRCWPASKRKLSLL